MKYEFTEKPIGLNEAISFQSFIVNLSYSAEQDIVMWDIYECLKEIAVLKFYTNIDCDDMYQLYDEVMSCGYTRKLENFYDHNLNCKKQIISLHRSAEKQLENIERQSNSSGTEKLLTSLSKYFDTMSTQFKEQDITDLITVLKQNQELGSINDLDIAHAVLDKILEDNKDEQEVEINENQIKNVN